MKLVSVEQMRALESQANRGGMSYAAMMERAGQGLARVVHERYFRRPNRRVVGLVGSGNNGGDTLVALRTLAGWGWQATAYLVKDREPDDELVKAFSEAGGTIYAHSADSEFTRLRELALSTDLILDGVLGTGVRLPLKGETKKVLGYLKDLRGLPAVIAVDCPSGVDCDSGKAAAECLPAKLTICMAAIKQGLVQQPALSFCGEILGIEIGLPADLKGWKAAEINVMDAESVARLLPERPVDGHKGTFGTCMLVAGSIPYCGAVLLAAQAAYRCGVGLVRVAIPGAIYDALAGQLPEATWLMLPHSQGIINAEAVKVVSANLERVTSLLIGPGWGQEEAGAAFLEKLLETRGKKSAQSRIGFGQNPGKTSEPNTNGLPTLVIDADALKLLKRIEQWERKIGKKAVLTPHPGEMAILTGLSVAEIQKNRIAIASEYARKWGHVVVLKGAVSVVADPEQATSIIPIASSALATAGTGDVLAGMIAGLAAQGVESYTAALAGCWLHARAGQKAAERLGCEASVMAGDLLQMIPMVIAQTGGQTH